ncbi:hypothetical protein HDA40_005499 [Hamadaea flava]|uniref:Uncharacterized protein n=1 Tax=Hamadaea flava TaxID=1742688 RepID=A0ABV8LXF8_9ACTN|nr:hypothetical protein [Hamadaea flava]MCP2326992.1 hypothetical protein [Hamadaea flava]
MAAITVTNSTPGWLTLWIEPLGEDRWLRPGEAFVVRSDYSGDQSAFTVQYSVNAGDRAAGIENVTVWIDQGDIYATVVDDQGRVIECGHQRPADISARWRASTDLAGGGRAAR